MLDKQHILVTGGAGFIGSHIVEALVAKGALVTVLDNLSTGTLENINTVKHAITFRQGDITHLPTCLDATYKQDLIIHAAAYVNAAQSVEEPDICHAINVTGTCNILNAARINKVRTMIFISSAAVYGPTQEPCIETMPLNPCSPYGLSKAMGEHYCQLFSRLYGINIAIARFFNIFGQRQRANHPYAGVVAQFRHCMEHNKPITIFGDGSQTRDFMPVHETVDALLTLAQVTHAHSLPDHLPIVNIARGKSISLLTLINQLKQEFPTYTAPLIFAPARQGDIMHSQAIVTRYQQLRTAYQH